MTPAFCPQCGRQFPAADLLHSSTVSCPGCGYTMRLVAATPGGDMADDDSATRPVPREALPVAPVASGAHTPAAVATPDALDSATQPAPARDARPDATLGMRTADLPPQLAPAEANANSPNADPPSTPGEGSAEASASAAGAPGDGRQRRPWVAISVVTLIAILLAAALIAVFITSPQSGGRPSTAQATATTAPTPTATPVVTLPTTTFTKAGFYSLKYPAAWLVTQQNNAGGSLAVFTAQQSGGVNPAINIQVIPQNESPADMATRDNDILQTAASANSLHNVTSPISVVVGGQSWTQKAADLTLNGSTQTVHMVVLSVLHGQYVYSVTYFAVSADFAGLDAAAFQPALASFTFLS